MAGIAQNQARSDAESFLAAMELEIAIATREMLSMEHKIQLSLWGKRYSETPLAKETERRINGRDS